MNALLTAAAEYTALGLSVIALTGKTPNGAIHPHWRDDAFSGADVEFGDAFTHPKTTGIGILTGGPMFVVDIDGEDGAKQWLEIAGEDDFMPGGWVASTHHGLHLYYATWTPRACRKLGSKLDLKGEGGYVVAAPSEFAQCDESPCPRPHQPFDTYMWLLAPGSQPIYEAPPGLTRLLDQGDALKSQNLVNREAHSQVRHAVLEDGKIWNTLDFSGAIDTMRKAPAGKRNELLNWCAYRMASDGATESEFMELYDAAKEAGLRTTEIKLTIKSGQRAAARG